MKHIKHSITCIKWLVSQASFTNPLPNSHQIPSAIVVIVISSKRSPAGSFPSHLADDLFVRAVGASAAGATVARARSAAATVTHFDGCVEGLLVGDSKEVLVLVRWSFLDGKLYVWLMMMMIKHELERKGGRRSFK
jgi:hypothetical protein